MFRAINQRHRLPIIDHLLPSLFSQTWTMTNHLWTTAFLLSSGLAHAGRRLLQVHVVHRHGDRTPITSMKDEAFWESTLIPDPLKAKIAEKTTLVLPGDDFVKHKANGRGPFGKLTELGLYQMVQVGNDLREQYATADSVDPNDSPFLWHANHPLTPSSVRVYSTFFDRTIESVQGVLVGLFPDGLTDTVPIDVRHTHIIIPDPQPRRTKEQEDLEDTLAVRPYLLAKEQEMMPLAVRLTNALQPLLADDARAMDYGVSQQAPHDISIEIEPLAWNQLAEVLKCLSVRERFPEGVTMDDLHEVTNHAAWRWFQALRHPRLAYISMQPFVSKIVRSLQDHENEPAMTLWSAHDSALIGLLCALRLVQPVDWPEYASCLKVELWSVEGEKMVRFRLNDEVLASEWDEPLEMIPLDVLVEKIKIDGLDATM